MENELFHSRESIQEKNLNKFRSLYCQGRNTNNPQERLKFVEMFYDELQKIETPAGQLSLKDDISRVANIIFNGKSPGYLSVGGGTSGQRIFFRGVAHVPEESHDYDSEDIIKEEPVNGYITIVTPDGKPRWMIYYEPTGSDKGHGEEYWRRFMDAFGTEVVDLMKK